MRHLALSVGPDLRPSRRVVRVWIVEIPKLRAKDTSEKKPGGDLCVFVCYCLFVCLLLFVCMYVCMF
jgi:hypothetical protein